ncbi:MAG: MMPL family transporter [Actinobacteria bacterium]|nr:MMPL family transporter [Actinomycetota bacterium]
MSLERFARAMVRRRRTVVAAWAAALVAISVMASAWGGDHHVDYSIPGSDSAAALELLEARLPEMAGDTAQLVYVAPEGVESAEAGEQLAAINRAAAALDHVAAVLPPAISPDGTVALVTLQLDAPTEQIPVSLGEALIELAERSDTPALTVEAGGAAVQMAEGTEAGSEQIGLIAALVILLIAFGSVIAAGMPLVVALFGVGVALAVGKLLTHVFMVPDWAPQLVTMIGIGVGIDYALFVVVRYRSAVESGLSSDDAVVHSINTAGRAVLFAGGTVVISLLGLCAMGMEYLYGTAAVTVSGVLIVLVASMTLLPALLGIVGPHLDRVKVPFVRGDRGEHGMWARWSRVVMHRPLATGAIALAVLLALAAPFGSLRFGYPDAGNGPTHLTSRRAFDVTTTTFGPGTNGPLVLAIDTAGEQALLDQLADRLRATPGVAAVLPPQIGADGTSAAMIVLPATGPQAEATQDLIHTVRDDVLPTVVGSAQRVHVGGLTATQVDESEFMAPRLPLFIGAVIAVSFLLLLLVFRSLLVAVKAAVMNLLAIGASYGIMALALRGGWFGELFGITEPTPIPAWAPMMMFALLFGLSMDYEVFLLSRIAEEYRRTGDNASAVAVGMARTGRVITAAAAIMVTVFGAFILGDQVLIKVIGLGLSSAVLLDATVVRMVLVPSTMELLGDRNWWLPGWLDRLLPHLDVEGEHASSAMAAAGHTADRQDDGGHAGRSDQKRTDQLELVDVG